ncbi:MAG: FGGY family carbohydrate kinase [Thaumarchaeota archaeon]|nr:FGGY family carbohydrate kinase [Nitrososphaerota archaeon]
MRPGGEPAFCVIDVGTGGVKCLVFDKRGSLLFKVHSSINFRFDGPAIDFDPQAVWIEICNLTKNAARECSKKNFQIISVSSTSMREGNVFYDSEEKELLAVPNLDARAYPEAEILQEKLGERVYSTTGHWPSAIFALTRLKWLEKNKTELFKKIRKVSMINDWVLFKFSGKIVSEPTNGCETSLFDLAKRDWSEDLIKDSGLDRSLFPPVQECGTKIDQISKEVSGKTDLEDSTEVIVGAADTEAAVAGCGLFEEGQVAAVAGTTTPVQAVIEAPTLDPQNRTWTCCHVVPNRWTLESNAGATGLVFKWWSEVVGKDFGLLDSEVEARKMSASNVKLSIGTSLMNARHPHPLSGVIQGVNPWTPRSDITFAILQTNSFSVRANLEQLEKVLENKFSEVYFCGGASRSSLWSQLQADVLGRPLVIHGTGEATGRGAAMLSAVGAGEFPDMKKATQSFLSDQSVLRPDMGSFQNYESQYQSWFADINK